MPKNQVPLTIESPGFLGLNTQNSGSVLPPGWATKLRNFVYDDVGRLASRQGSRQQHTTGVGSQVRQLHEYIDGAGASLIIFAAGNAIYKLESNTATDISGTITTPTGDDWQFANFNGSVVGYQAGHTPIILSSTSGTFADATGTSIINGTVVASAYGRTWTVLNNTLYYSDLLVHDYAGGTSGSANLSLYWPNGMDEAQAIVAFNGFLTVFGKESIIVYENADDIVNFGIVEGIEGIGCIARDSVQVIGNDIAFLSSTGIRTLSRVVQEKSMPLGDISRHVRDQLIVDALQEQPLDIKSVYNRDEGFYALSFPVSGITYVFDLKFPNQDGTWKVTSWDITPSAMLYTESLDMYMAVETGFVSLYNGYQDNKDLTGNNGINYFIEYEGPWVDFGGEVASLLKIPKRVGILAAGVAGGNLSFRWATDYQDNFKETQLTFQNRNLAQYGVAQYTLNTYSGAVEFERVRGQMSSAGQVLKLGMRMNIQDVKFAIQRVDILAKTGRIGI